MEAEVEVKKDTGPKFHNPAKLYDDEMMARKIAVQTPAFAPKDKLEDLRKQPDWLLPELRQWASIPDDQRLKKIKEIIASPKIEAQYKEKCLRWTLTVEPTRRIAVEIANHVWPKEK